MEPLVALAQSRGVVAGAPAGAVPACFVAKAADGVGERGAFFVATVGSAEPGVAEASPNLHGVPGLVVDVAGHLRKDALREALSVVAAIVPALVALAGHAFKGGVAFTLARVAVARAPIRALHKRVGVVVLGEHVAGPGQAVRASPGRAVDAHPERLAVEPFEAIATIALRSAAPVAVAIVFARVVLSRASMLENHVECVSAPNIGRSLRRDCGWLASG